MTVSKHNDLYLIKFPFDIRLVEAVKNLPDRRYNAETKSWTVPIEYHNAVISFANKYGFSVEDNKSSTIEQSQVAYTIPDLPYLDEERQKILKRPLFPFQARGVAYALNKKRLIIGDQMGTGKTTQAAATVFIAGALPCLIICPATLKENWKREFETVTGKKAMILNDASKKTFMRFYDAGFVSAFVVNYESLSKYFVKEIKIPKGQSLRLNHIIFNDVISRFKSIIIDESHKVKSTKTKQSKITKGICDKKEYVLALTGTPVVNKPFDLYSQLGIIGRISDFGGYNTFVKQYCSGPRKASNLEELNYKLNTTCYFARKKSDVMKDLPLKTRQVVMCDIDEEHQKEYLAAEDDLENYMATYLNASQDKIDAAMRAEVMVRITKLKSISARGKLKAIYDYIQDIIDNDEKIVVFVHLRDIALKIKEQFPDALTLTGADDIKDRQKSIDTFQQDDSKKLIIASIQAGGVGVTLTAASQVAFVELGWTAAIHDQAEDRCHRIGQKDNVTCTYFLGKMDNIESIDEYTYGIIEKKRDIAATVSGSADEINTNVFNDIIKLMTKRRK